MNAMLLVIHAVFVYEGDFKFAATSKIYNVGLLNLKISKMQNRKLTSCYGGLSLS